MTATISAEPITRRNTGALRTEGRDLYRASLATGRPMTGAELGAAFGRTAGWGDNRIKEVTEDMAAMANPIAPPMERTQPSPRPQPTDNSTEIEVMPDLDVEVVAPEAPADLHPVPPEPVEPADQPASEPDDVAGKDDGKNVALLGLVLGILASIAANVMHSRVEGSASFGELIGAALVPCFLLVTIEVAIRTRWSTGAWWTAIRIGSCVMVGLPAALISYRHMQGLLAAWGEGGSAHLGPVAMDNSHIGPLAVDGLTLICAAALSSISRSRRSLERN